jgi:hypothetical protein
MTSALVAANLNEGTGRVGSTGAASTLGALGDSAVLQPGTMVMVVQHAAMTATSWARVPAG